MYFCNLFAAAAVKVCIFATQKHDTMKQFNLLALLEEQFIASPYKKVVSALPLCRLENGSQRAYYLKNDPQQRLFMSCTTFTRSVLPSSPFLDNWKRSQASELGKEMAEFEFELTALYGTVLHLLIGYIVQQIDPLKGIELRNFEDTAKDIAIEYVQHYGKINPLTFWAKRGKELLKDCRCFCQFCVDTKAEIIASEYRVVDYENLIAGTLDLVMRLTDSRGKSEVCIVDIKSGKKSGEGGFYDSHKLQLAFLQHAWNNQADPNIPKAQSVANFAPKDYRKETPTYSFVKHKADDPVICCLPEYFGILRKQNLVDKMTPKGLQWRDGQPYFDDAPKDLIFSYQIQPKGDELF